MSNKRVSCLILLLYLLLHSFTAAAQIRAKVKIEGLPDVLQKNRHIVIVRVIEVETAKVVSAVRFRKPSGIALLSSEPLNIFVDFVDSKKNKQLYGVSNLLRPVAGKKYKARIRIRKKLGVPQVIGKAGVTSALSLPAGARVGIPSAAFSASGPGMGPHIARGEADMLITDLVQAPCYRNGFREGSDFQDGEKFVIREMDPDKLAAAQKEIDLTQSEDFDPATRLTNKWQPPTVLVNGQVVSDGTTMTITVNVTDASGNLIFSESASGPATKRFDVHDELAKKLKDKFCEEQSVTIEQMTCPATTCRCCSLEDPACYGKWWHENWSGTAKGPVGSVFDVNIIASPDYGTLSCGGWSEDVVSNLRACRRTSEGQPQSISFEASRRIFPADFPLNCLCPDPEASETDFLAEIVAPENEYSADEQYLNCPQ